ncbi:hypothetical protein NLU13_6260 [Sarocladium strictum]|uniref:NADAR domain-containing protein n=1 Tax=Sarocladium strictum TaxID=5046 RepID=A0AA39GFJ9_SARSR|nr:hypothetical protein NLU13_6260 [Sarocladium strictum]
MPPSQARRKPKKGEPVFFYKPNGSYGVFCQWYPSKFTVSSADIEQFMMYCKAARFSDETRQRQVLNTADPSRQKRIGKKVDGFFEEYWTEVKSQVVEMGNYAKFTQDEQLKQWLLGTGDRELVEASPRDKVWGIGFAAETEDEIRIALEHREYWGENRLGEALKAVRTRIREESNASTTEQSNAC